MPRKGDGFMWEKAGTIRGDGRPVRAQQRIAPLVLAALAGLATTVGLSAQEVTVTSHAVTTFDDPPKYPADFTHLAYVNPDAPKGGEISGWSPGSFDSFNPFSVNGLAAVGSTIGLESLMTATADEVGALYCLLCESIEYPADKAWVIFTLHEGIQFSDGTPMTADDVAFSHELFASQGLPSYQELAKQMVASVEVLDARRIKFGFVPASAPRERIQFVAGLSVLSRAQVETSGMRIDESRLEPWLGSGPYRLESFDPGKQVIYSRNPDYWGKDLPIMRGRANFDTIRYEYFADSTAAFEGFKAGEYTFRNENSSRQWATAYDFPALVKGWVVKTELPDGSVGTGQSFVFNMRKEKFKDRRVREAIGLMFNFEWSNETLFYGLYARTTSFWDNSDLAATGTPSAEELDILKSIKAPLPDGVMEADVVLPPVSGEKQLDRNNLRKASQLLDEAGWLVGDDGMRRNDKSELLTIGILEYEPTFDRIVNPYVENLRALGVDAKLDRVDSAQYVDRVRGYDFDMVNTSFSGSLEPGLELEQDFGTKGTTDSKNAMALSDPAIDELIAQAVNSKSRDELKVRIRTLDRVLRAYLFWVPQWYKNMHTVAYYDMYDHPATLPPFARGEMDFWWYNAEKAEALRAAGAIK